VRWLLASTVPRRPLYQYIPSSKSETKRSRLVQCRILSSCSSEDGFASLEWIFPMLLLARQLSTQCIRMGQDIIHVLQSSFETICLASSVFTERRDTRVTVQRIPNSFGIFCSKVYISLEHFEIASAAVDSAELWIQTQARCLQTKSPHKTSSRSQ
jgi:hypothetical protein